MKGDFDGLHLEGSGPPVLIIHGLSSSPQELLSLGLELQRGGQTVFIPRLSGHASSIRDFHRTTSKQWILDAHRALEIASSHGSRPCVLIGHSFGSTLALMLAAGRPSLVNRLVLLSPALTIKPYAANYLLRFLALLPEPLLNFLPLLPKRQNRNYCLVVPRSAYPVHSVAALARMMRIIRRTQRRLSRVSQPTLICFDPLDHLAHLNSLTILEDKLGSKIAGCLAFPGGNHELLNGKHREQVIGHIRDFVLAQEAPAAVAATLSQAPLSH